MDHLPPRGDDRCDLLSRDDADQLLLVKLLTFGKVPCNLDPTPSPSTTLFRSLLTFDHRPRRRDDRRDQNSRVDAEQLLLGKLLTFGKVTCNLDRVAT